MKHETKVLGRTKGGEVKVSCSCGWATTSFTVMGAYAKAREHKEEAS